jgi:hypothetical protein
MVSGLAQKISCAGGLFLLAPRRGWMLLLV